MINYNYETDFNLDNEDQISQWILSIVNLENFKAGDINYIFCDDQYLHKINLEYLNHDTLTDIISFDYSVGKKLQGDIFISIERVAENADKYKVSFDDELHRVLAHGILHYCGYKDKTESDAEQMRSKENFYLSTRKFIS